jgi:tyrosyl-DNA phosphodiesterase-1
MDRSPKRQKVTHGGSSDAVPSKPADPRSIRRNRAAFLNSISRSISPPGVLRSGTNSPRHNPPQTDPVVIEIDEEDNTTTEPLPRIRRPRDEMSTKSARNEVSKVEPTKSPQIPNGMPTVISSPFRLMTIRDLPASQNKDTVSLHDILGNPLIKEAWIFNYCFDIDWMMTHFDPDVRALVKVRVVHGSWKKEDGNRIGIEDACRRWPNVEAATAYLPDPFGTHHSKMFVLFTHDDQSQVIIHTANMLNKDWSNMTQAIWQSPLLPKLDRKSSCAIGRYGSGSRFKHDFMAYLNAYGSKTKALRDQLDSFDFTAIRGALVSSVPSRMKDPAQKTLVEGDEKLWGYPSLCRVLSTINTPKITKSTVHPHLVCQVSSIATLPQTWLSRFFNSIFDNDNKTTSQFLNHVSIIYPTPSNVASSLDGYASGGSIHTKAQSAAHLKQISSLRSTLSQWTEGPAPGFRAKRHEAAPHIKTYVQYRAQPTAENPAPEIDWALLTSANLSTQAWGAFREKEKEVVVQSFEIGVLVWPELFSDDFDKPTVPDNRPSLPTSSKKSSSYLSNDLPPPQHSSKNIHMIPVFGKDTPSSLDIDVPTMKRAAATAADKNDTSDQPSTVIGLRIPYDLPLTRYSTTELPWSPQGTYETRDKHGRRWPRDFFH